MLVETKLKIDGDSINYVQSCFWIHVCKICYVESIIYKDKILETILKLYFAVMSSYTLLLPELMHSQIMEFLYLRQKDEIKKNEKMWKDSPSSY